MNNYCEVKEGANYVRPLKMHNGLLTVIDRASGKIQLLKLGDQLMKEFRSVQDNPGWNDLGGYDICITRRAAGHEPPFIVHPQPKKPLSVEDRDLIKEYNEQNSIKIKEPMKTMAEFYVEAERVRKNAKPFCVLCKENIYADPPRIVYTTENPDSGICSICIIKTVEGLLRSSPLNRKIIYKLVKKDKKARKAKK